MKGTLLSVLLLSASLEASQYYWGLCPRISPMTGFVWDKVETVITGSG